MQKVDDQEKNLQRLLNDKQNAERRLNAFSFKWWHWLIAGLVGLVVGLYFAYEANQSYQYINSERANDAFRFVSFGGLGLIVSEITYLYFMAIPRAVFGNSVRRIERQIIDNGGIQLQTTIEEDFFNKLVKINFNYIDKYYLQTQEQADKSFRLIIASGIVGVAIVIAGLALLVLKLAEPGYIASTVGFLVEVVTSILFVTYNKTIQKMSEYHEKLVLTQNISLALKISQELEPSDRSIVQKEIVSALVKDINAHIAGSLPRKQDIVPNAPATNRKK